MSTPSSAESKPFKESSSLRELSYDAYASHYDQLCDLLPVYRDNIDSLLELLPKLELPTNPRICDLGAGTGNYVQAVANALPHASFVHVDKNASMNEFAKKKYGAAGLKNVEVVEEFIERIDFPTNHFDLVICVNALNTASPQLPVLRKIRRWLKPHATLFLIDFGRRQRVLDWGWYIFSSAVKDGTLNRYFRALFKNREFIKQNRLAAKDQSNGLMWTHTLEEFRGIVAEAGFDINKAETCYRGYCDMVIAKNPDFHTPKIPISDISHDQTS